MKFFTFLFCLLFTAFLFAQESPDSTLTDSSSTFTPIENSLFWEISGNGLKKPSYLFGTIHLIPEDSFFIQEVMRERMPEADRLLLEIEMDMGSMLTAAFGALTPSEKSLKEVLSSEDYAYLKSFIEDSLPSGGGGLFGLGGISMQSVERQKPIFTMQQISSLYCQDMSMESGESVVYEMYLSEEFKETERPVGGLETAADQLAAFDAIPMEEQAQQLIDAIRNPDEMCGGFGDLVSIYRSQDLEKLMEATTADPAMGNHLDVLLYNRNRNWIPVIEDYLKSEVIFIAVGAGHLPGEYGVVNLLREQGYVLKPLRD